MGTVSKEEIDRYENLMSKVVVAADREIKRAEAARDKAEYEKDNCYSLRELEMKSRLQEIDRENKQLKKDAGAHEKDSRFVNFMRERYDIREAEKEFEKLEKTHTRTHERNHER